MESESSYWMSTHKSSPLPCSHWSHQRRAGTTAEATHLVPIKLAELLDEFFAVGQTAEVVEHVIPPLVGSDRGSGECPVIILHVGNKDIQSTDQSLDVKEQVGAFFIGDLTVSLIR